MESWISSRTSARIVQLFLTLVLSPCLLLWSLAQAETETITYLHTDHLGSPILATDQNGNVVWEQDYGPWGELLQSGTPRDVSYTGHFEEGELELIYAGARWYDPEVGRFLSPDPVGITTGGMKHLNRYIYANNNPLKYIDHDGRAAQCAPAVLGGPVGVGGCLGASLVFGGLMLMGATNSANDGVERIMQLSEGGAKDAPEADLDADAHGWIYGPEGDSKINPDGSTTGSTWTTPDDFGSREEAQDKLDPFKPLTGRRPVTIPAGTKVRQGRTPGGEGPYQGSGGANEILVEGGLPPGSVGAWEPLR